MLRRPLILAALALFSIGPQSALSRTQTETEAPPAATEVQAETPAPAAPPVETQTPVEPPVEAPPPAPTLPSAVQRILDGHGLSSDGLSLFVHREAFPSVGLRFANASSVPTSRR